MKPALEAQQGRGTIWRPLTKRERGRSPRCGAIGLALGDCDAQHLPGSRYCYYHDKRANGAIDFCMAPSYVSTGTRDSDAETSGWVSVPVGNVYPVNPLPAQGYAFIGEAVAA